MEPEQKEELLEILRSIQDDVHKQQDKLFKILQLTLDGLWIDGINHKQWYLEQILEALGISVEEWREKGDWDKGVQP